MQNWTIRPPPTHPATTPGNNFSELNLDFTETYRNAILAVKVKIKLKVIVKDEVKNKVMVKVKIKVKVKVKSQIKVKII